MTYEARLFKTLRLCYGASNGRKSSITNELDLNNTDNNDYVRGCKDGIKSANIKWEAKVQELLDTLKWIQMHCPVEAIVDDAICAALAKYKEVGDG